MEEIIEFNQEIEMKQRFIQSRMRLLHKIIGQVSSNEKRQRYKKIMMGDLFPRLKPFYPHAKYSKLFKLKGLGSVYTGEGENKAIPAQMKESVYEEIFELKMDPGEPISLPYYDQLERA